MTTIDLFPLPGDDGPEMTSPFDVIRHVDPVGREVWYGRDLQAVMGYTRWESFEVPINRAMKAAKNVGMDVTSNFRRSPKINGTRPAVDYELSRAACYLVAMNGDPNKPEVAAAQAYFAVRTREAEVAVPKMRQLSNREWATMVLAAEDRADAEAVRANTAEQRAAELEPAAQSWETLASAEGDYSVADAAKTLARDGIKIGRGRLFTKLREIGWAYRDRGDRRHRAYQTAVDRGWLVERATSHEHPDTGERVIDPPQIRVTVKGLGVLRERLAEGGELESA